MSIQTQNLTKIYGNQKAVDNISFEVQQGEIVGFLGPNGAGKSTTMKMLTCYTAPNSGQATVSGINILDDPFAVKKEIGYLPEHNPLYPDMYVREYLLFMAQVHAIGKHKKRRVEEVIQKTGLTPESGKKIKSLSKGYRQRVGLAQAILHNPNVLILDEPTSGLDPNQLEDIRQLIRELGKEKTVMLSTHIMQEVEAMCDRVLIINKGKIVADDTVAQIRKKQTNAQSVLFQVSPVLKKKDFNIDGWTIESVSEKMWRLRSTEKKDVRKQLFDHCVAKNYTLLHMEEEQSTLESLFKKLTK